MRIFRQPPRMPLLAHPDPALRRQNFRPSARSNRYSHRRSGGQFQRAARPRHRRGRQLRDDSRAGHPSQGNPVKKIGGRSGLFEFGDVARAYSQVLRARRRKRKPARTRHAPAGSVGPRARPDSKSRAHHRRSRSERKHSDRSPQRSDKLSLARPQLLDIKFFLCNYCQIASRNLHQSEAF